jgi:LPXTG-motif cell wall-anchored protein
VTNSGPSAALGVTVQEDLPVGGAVTDATATQGGYDAATGIWTVGAGAPAVLTLTVAYDRPGATVSTVTVAGADSTGTATVAVLPAAVTPAPPAPAPDGGGGFGGSLPDTGLPADHITVAGLGLLLIGLVLTLVARRRRTA